MPGLSASPAVDGLSGVPGLSASSASSALDGVHHMPGLSDPSVMDGMGGMGGMDHMAGLSDPSVMDGLTGMGALDWLTGLVAMAGHGGLGMIAAHLLAALFCAGWLAWGEAAVFRLARALGATALLAARPLASALALVRTQVAPVPPRPAPRRTCARPRRLRGGRARPCRRAAGTARGPCPPSHGPRPACPRLTTGAPPAPRREEARPGAHHPCLRQP
ncbi:hypothetical protein GCM10020254_59020 [Streptomyces goshikiensis]